MIAVDLTKLSVALAVVVGVIVLLALEVIDQGAGLGLVGTVVGYTLGNGRSIAKGDQPGTMLSRTDRADDA